MSLKNMENLEGKAGYEKEEGVKDIKEVIDAKGNKINLYYCPCHICSKIRMPAYRSKRPEGKLLVTVKERSEPTPNDD